MIAKTKSIINYRSSICLFSVYLPFPPIPLYNLPMPQEPVISIAEYIELLNEQLKMYKARIIGEVTQAKISTNGHVYFTMKDKDSGAVIDCVIWRGIYALFGIRIEPGLELILTGQANIYARSGRLSFVASVVELVGEGSLKKAYDALKRKLTIEGIFADERKKPLPNFPRRIGVITSIQGAVIHDFVNNLNQHGFQITLLDTRVEGPEALPDIYRAIRTMKKKDVEVIVLMRGGGSLQSLAAFDAEMLVREIAESPMPVIAAIGHHQDVPLAALAADVMVSTPTAAANLLNHDWEEAQTTLAADYQRILTGFKYLTNEAANTIRQSQLTVTDKFNRVLLIFGSATARFPEYMNAVATSIRQNADTLTRDTQHIITRMTDAIIGQQKDIVAFERLIHVHDPMRLLALGYSLIQRKDGRLVKNIKDVTIGETLTLTVNDGSIASLVESIHSKKTDDQTR